MINLWLSSSVLFVLSFWLPVREPGSVGAFFLLKESFYFPFAQRGCCCRVTLQSNALK